MNDWWKLYIDAWWWSILFLQRAGGKTEDEYDYEDPAERGSQNGVRESATKNEWHADIALPHSDAGSVSTSSGTTLS